MSTHNYLELFRSAGDPVLFLSNPPGIDRVAQRDSLDTLRKLNERRLGVMGDPEIAARISSFEMAYRMQASATDLMDLSKEPRAVLEMYGAEPGKPSFADNCLLARRLVERGVRFVQLFHEAWDHHGGQVKGLKGECGKTDRPAAALIKESGGSLARIWGEAPGKGATLPTPKAVAPWHTRLTSLSANT
jgi:hypothetical protein